MRVTFFGATGTVTGSKYLVAAGGRSILVDCGLFQGYKQLRLRNWDEPSFDPRSIDAVLLTHAHIDHSGYLPLLVRRGFRGPVYASAATRDLCRILLPDSGHLQEEEAEFLNRHGKSRHAPALPLYTEQDAHAAAALIEPVGQDGRVDLGGGVGAEFHMAGHILGASMVRIADGRHSVLFSGDLGRAADLVMRPPTVGLDADQVVVESTYGDRLHAPDDPVERLGAIVRRSASRGGAVVIPAFAVGRAQALLFALYRLRVAGGIPRSLPIFLDSPMAIDATALYRRHRADHRLSAEECEGMCKVARLARTRDESKAIDELHGPKVIVSASGMATGGRVLHHLRAYGPDPRSSIVLAGFQAGGTRGADLAAGARELKIFGDYVEIRAEVERLDNLSAHADQAELLAWLAALGRPPRRVHVTHGEPGASDRLRFLARERLHLDASVPEYRQTIDLAKT